MRFRLCHTLSILSGLFAVGVIFARIVPGPDLRRLVSDAELIVVGRVTTIEPQGGSAKGLQSVIVELDVRRVLKGKQAHGLLTFRSASPQVAGLTGPIAPKQLGMFFLRKAKDNIETVNPYYPVLPVSQEGPRAGDTAFDKVVEEIVLVLEAQATTKQDFERVVYLLRNVQHPSVLNALKRVALKEDARGLKAIGELLLRGDISLLSKAERLLTRQAVQDPGLRRALGESLEGIKDPAAVPALSRLIRFGEVEARRAAATALGNTRSNKAVPALGHALYDPDQEVRYQAVIALEEIRRQRHWAISLEYFQREEKQLLEFWRNWVRNVATPKESS